MKLLWRDFDKNDILFSLADMIFELGSNTFIARNIGLATAGLILLVASIEACIMLLTENSRLITTLPLVILSVYPMLMNLFSYKWMLVMSGNCRTLYVTTTHQEDYPDYIMNKEKVLLGFYVFGNILNLAGMWVCVEIQCSGIINSVSPDLDMAERIMKWSVIVIMLLSVFSQMRLDFSSLYYFSCLRRQAYVVKKILAKTEILHKTHTSRNDNEAYQCRVRQYLILAIKTHQSMMRTSTTVVDRIGIDFYVLFLITIPLCSATLCMALQSISLGAFLPVISANLLLLFHTVIGQSCLDESSDIFTSAYFTPWHLFDKGNRKLLLIFMMNTRNGITFKKGNVSLDLSTFASQLKVCFSAGLTLYQAFSWILQE